MNHLERYGYDWRLRELKQTVGVWLFTEIGRDDPAVIPDGFGDHFIVNDEGQRCVLVRGVLTPEQADLIGEQVQAALNNLAEMTRALNEAPLYVDLLTAEDAALIAADEERARRGR